MADLSKVPTWAKCSIGPKYRLGLDANTDMDKGNLTRAPQLHSTATWATLFDVEGPEGEPELTQEQFEAEIERAWADHVH